jgi:hypothetical protein
MIRFIALCLLLVSISNSVFSQESKRARKQRTGRKNSELVDFSGRYKLSGWHFAPGVDYTLTRFKNSEETLINRNDTLYNATFDPNGKFGLYLEVGRYRLFKYGRLFNYMDYSLAYKAIKGTESYEGTLMTESTSTILATTGSDAIFKHKYLLANVNFNNIKQLGSYSFLQNSLGFNVDYRFADKRTNHDNIIGQTQADPSRLLAQLHYKIGFGYKLNDRWFIIPTLETPILNLFQWDKFKSTDPMFSSRYRPIILTIRFAWLRKVGPGDCLTPDVPGERDKQKAFDLER